MVDAVCPKCKGKKKLGLIERPCPRCKGLGFATLREDELPKQEGYDAFNVQSLNNITSKDLDPELVLTKAKGKLEAVVLVGYDKNGKEYFASTIANGADVNWLFDRFKKKLIEQVDKM